jgi:hypothetical protein
LFCHVNSINYPNEIYIESGHAHGPVSFEKGPLRHGGDGESVQCLKAFALGPPECADVTIVVDYTLVDQPNVPQEKTFRFATTGTGKSLSWSRGTFSHLQRQ